jgi:hypothetical protein
VDNEAQVSYSEEEEEEEEEEDDVLGASGLPSVSTKTQKLGND